MTHQRVICDEKRDGVVGGVKVGESTVICLEYEVCVRDPDGWHASRCEVTLQVLAQFHTPPAPVQHLVHVAQQVYRRQDADNHEADDQQRQHNAAPVVAVVCSGQHQVLGRDTLKSNTGRKRTYAVIRDQTSKQVPRGMYI